MPRATRVLSVVTVAVLLLLAASSVASVALLATLAYSALTGVEPDLDLSSAVGYVVGVAGVSLGLVGVVLGSAAVALVVRRETRATRPGEWDPLADDPLRRREG